MGAERPHLLSALLQQVYGTAFSQRKLERGKSAAGSFAYSPLLQNMLGCHFWHVGQKEGTSFSSRIYKQSSSYMKMWIISFITSSAFGGIALSRCFETLDYANS